MSAEKTGDLDRLSQRLGYVFRRPELLEEAFRHASYVNEMGGADLSDNERLEFLGDAVLDLAISHICMDLFRDAREGDLSKYRAWVVNERGLCQVAMELDLGAFLLLGKGEEATQGREKPSILANTLEALFGAIYLDGGFEIAKEIIHRLFEPHLARIDSGQGIDDYKSLLQEYTQERFKSRPEYAVIDENGPAHDKTFRVALILNGKVMSEGEGKSKKEAEQRAAKEAFRCLKRDPADP
ncbi:MAG: ribonuclease III [Deltaproteobacteria bacterium]|nr:ribonuclease III [Deltaproteobacteria bacterium]